MLNYRIAGKGKGVPLVLIHAWPLSSRMWEKQLEALSDQFCVIAPDVPGLGKSPRQSAPSIAEAARQAAELLDHLQIKEPVMISGLSVGGYVTFEFIRQFPERVRAVGLFATRANADTPEVRERRFKNIEFLKTHLLKEFLPRVVPGLLLGKTAMAENPKAVKETESIILENHPDGIADVLRAMAARRDSTEMLAEFRWPTLVMAGDEDGFVTVEESKAMHAKIPGAEFHLMKHTGHLLNLENPGEFNETVRRFISRRCV